MRRVLLVHRYFWPDVPTYARMLRFIGARLAADGHDVTVLCGQPTYNGVYAGPRRPRVERIDGMRVRRVGSARESKHRPAMRGLSLAAFAARLVAHLVRRRYDLVVVTTTPAVLMGLAAQIGCRLTGVAYVYHCMDLYPEAAESAGLTRNRLLLRLARRIDTATCRRAACVVVLSEDMRTTLLDRGLDGANILVRNNFEIIEASDDPVPDVLPRDPDRFRVTVAGNLGRFQGWEELVAAAHLVTAADPRVDFVFIGAGVLAETLRDQAAGNPHIRFIGHQPVAAAALALEHSDLAVVSLRAGIYRVAYPSKTATSLAAGCRILAVVEDDSELGCLVRDEDLGSVCAPGDVPGLADAILAEVARGPAAAAERDRLREVGAKWFDRAARLEEWSAQVADLTRS
jgi:glycosyltransferase involved in cell wall biosynthesis